MRSLVLSIFLHACESWTLTAELEKRTRAFEMRCYRSLLNIQGHVNNEDVRRKIQAAIGNHNEPYGQETETEGVWPYLKVIRLSKDDSTGQSERKTEGETEEQAR